MRFSPRVFGLMSVVLSLIPACGPDPEFRNDSTTPPARGKRIVDAGFEKPRLALADPEAWHGPSIQKLYGYQAHLDCSQQILSLGIPVQREYGQEEREEAPLTPTLGNLAGVQMISASMLAQKAKLFDDGLYTAVDLASQDGLGLLIGKKALLRRLSTRLAGAAKGSSDGPRARIAAAARLGGQDPILAPGDAAVVERMIKEFVGKPVLSKPIGAYTWNRELEQLFQQDRMLQQPLRGQWPGHTEKHANREMGKLIRTLHQDAGLRAEYEAQLDLAARLTSPQVSVGLRRWLTALDASASAPLRFPGMRERISFSPPSRSHETSLIKELFANSSIPEGFNLMEELIERITAGRISLQPRADSGWYEYQTWALEPLLLPSRMPEAPALDLSTTYLKQLRELFQGILALTRETHVKQLEFIWTTGIDRTLRLRLSPRLRVEPLASHYLRRAQGYRFVHNILNKSFGPDALSKIHRLTSNGPAELDLEQELAMMESLFHGAYLTACEDLGRVLPSPASFADQREEDLLTFRDWAMAVDVDPDLGKDCRMMVPVYQDEERGLTKVWLFLGWTFKKMDVGYTKRPRMLRITDDNGKSVPASKYSIDFESNRYRAPYPVMAEAYTARILDRKEFRALCDKFKTKSAIFKNLLLEPTAASKHGSHMDIPEPKKQRTVTIQKGDTVSSLARRHLGTVARYREILDLNNLTEASARKLRIGTVLRLPR